MMNEKEVAYPISFAISFLRYIQFAKSPVSSENVNFMLNKRETPLGFEDIESYLHI